MPLSGAANPHEDGSHPPTSTPASLTMRGSPPEEDGTHATPWRSVEREERFARTPESSTSATSPATATRRAQRCAW